MGNPSNHNSPRRKKDQLTARRRQSCLDAWQRLFSASRHSSRATDVYLSLWSIVSDGDLAYTYNKIIRDKKWKKKEWIGTTQVDPTLALYDRTKIAQRKEGCYQWAVRVGWQSSPPFSGSGSCTLWAETMMLRSRSQLRNGLWLCVTALSRMKMS